ncbi:MAG: V-type ATPase subunit [Clostridiales bacterium]|jgi:V/A-type H+-transporting ATPase subunit C|nr:V-type ATPase subunit [Clostridiales bacterium]
MLSEVFKYSGACAKVKAMSGNFLSGGDYKALLSKTSVNDAAAYLKNHTSYGKALREVSEAEIHRGELEALLQDAWEREFVKLCRYEKGNNKKFFRVFILRYEIELLKQMLRMLESGRLSAFTDRTNGYYKKHMTIDPERLARSQNIPRFIENLRGSPYFGVLSAFTANAEHLNIFNIEMTLDVYYFTYAWKLIGKLLEKNDRRAVEKSFGTEVDLLNIMWIIRCKTYFDTPKEIIYSFILPRRYRLKHARLVALVEAKTPEETRAALRDTPYGAVFERDGGFMERRCYKFIFKNLLRDMRRMPFSIVSMLGYIHIKENEVGNIIKIIEGIRYGLDPGEIERYLIRDGGEEDGG